MAIDELLGGPLALSDAMARSYAPRVRMHAIRVARRLPQHITMAELVSAGFSGLVDAFLRYDGRGHESFEAYVDCRIRGAMLDELRARDPLPREQRAFVRRVASARRELEGSLGRVADSEEVARKLNLSLTEFQSLLGRADATAARSPTQGLEEDGSENAWGSNGVQRPDEAVEQAERYARVVAAVEALPSRQREMLQLYYNEGLTLRQIAARFDVTESRVSQIHSAAIAQLRLALADA